MTAQHFIDQLRHTPEKSIAFYANGKQLVPSHYHITEIKEVTTRSVDCGGRPHFDEHIEIQLWLAKQEDDGHRIGNADISKIVDLVDQKLQLNKALPIYFEYSDAFHATARYEVLGTKETDAQLLVDLSIPKTVCKPQLTNATACCAGPESC